MSPQSFANFCTLNLCLFCVGTYLLSFRDSFALELSGTIFPLSLMSSLGHAAPIEKFVIIPFKKLINHIATIDTNNVNNVFTCLCCILFYCLLILSHVSFVFLLSLTYAARAPVCTLFRT